MCGFVGLFTEKKSELVEFIEIQKNSVLPSTIYRKKGKNDETKKERWNEWPVIYLSFSSDAIFSLTPCRIAIVHLYSSTRNSEYLLEATDFHFYSLSEKNFKLKIENQIFV